LLAGLRKALPGRGGAALTMALLVLYVLFVFAYTYALSAKAFGI
jgi:hypothetical protein